MANIDTVIPLVDVAQARAYAVKGTPSPVDQVAALTASNATLQGQVAALTTAATTLTNERDALQGRIDAARTGAQAVAAALA